MKGIKIDDSNETIDRLRAELEQAKVENQRLLTGFLKEKVVEKVQELEKELGQARKDLAKFVPYHESEMAKVSDELEQARKKIEGLVEALKRIDVEDCGCGVPCDCYDWSSFARIAREALEAKGE